MDSSALVNTTIREVLISHAEEVHPVWKHESTTRYAARAAVLELSDGRLVKVEPCEMDFPGKYPALGLSLETCDSSGLRSERDKTMTPFTPAKGVLPFAVEEVVEADSLGEGPISEIRLIGPRGQLLFRHVYPPITLGIDVVQSG